MDWNEIRETGHACYNCSHLKERKRYWIFLLRTYFHQREMEGLQLFFMKHRYGQGSGPVCPASWNRLHGHFFIKGLPLLTALPLLSSTSSIWKRT